MVNGHLRPALKVSHCPKDPMLKCSRNKHIYSLVQKTGLVSEANFLVHDNCMRSGFVCNALI